MTDLNPRARWTWQSWFCFFAIIGLLVSGVTFTGATYAQNADLKETLKAIEESENGNMLSAQSHQIDDLSEKCNELQKEIDAQIAQIDVLNAKIAQIDALNAKIADFESKST